MKKFYSLLLMLCMASSMLFATDYWVAGELPGGYNWGDTRAEMTAKGNNIYTYSFTAEATSYEFKITACASGWDNCGNWGNNGGNYKITCAAGDKVVITFDANINKQSISVSIIEANAEYYIQHPWNSGGWSWKKLTADKGGTTYSIREIYGLNGNSGCDWKKGESGSKTFVENPTLEGGVVEGDSAVFTLDPSKGTITITKIVLPAAADYSVVLKGGDKEGSYDMTRASEEETPSYNYVLQNVAAGSYEFIIKNSKGGLFGWDKHEKSPNIELEEGTDNYIRFTLTEESNVAFIYDSKDSKVWLFVKGVNDTGVKYYISGTCTPNNWDSPHTLMLEENADNAIWSYTFDAKAGERYEFKITTGAWHWASNPLYEYKEYDAKCIDETSSIGLEGWQVNEYNNISFQLSENMTVKIVFDGKQYKVIAQKACGACLKLELI